jgi:hypothetical protein
LNLEVSEQLSRVVMRALARNPDERYARGRDLAADLRKVLASATATVPWEPIPTPARTRPGFAQALLVALVGAGILAGGGVTYKRLSTAEPGYVQATSVPEGADVLVDGRLVGQTPYTFELPAGRHEVEYRKDGYLPGQLTVMVASETRVPVKLALSALREGVK